MPKKNGRIAKTRKEWNYPFRKETLDKYVALGFCTRGNDIYWAMMNFVLQQTNIFRRLSVYTAVSLWGPGAESLFKGLAEYDCDYICMLDSDVAPRVETLVRMIERGKDIVSCPTWMYDGGNKDIHLNYHADDGMKREYVPQAGGLQKVFNTSWACVLISHRVLEAFVQLEEKFTQWSPLIEDRWQELPPDSLFFVKAQAMGFDIWMDWDLEFATHHKYVSLDARTCEKFVKERIFGIADDEEFRRAGNILARRQVPVIA